MKKIDLSFLFYGTFSMALAFATFFGYVQTMVYFAKPDNEIFFTAGTFTLGSLFLIGAFKK